MRLRLYLFALVLALFLAGCNRDRGYTGLPPASGTPAKRLEGLQSYSETVDKVAAAVVTIRSERRVRAPRQFPFFDSPLFREFFGNRGREMQPRDQIQRGLGSGVVVTADGYCLTNHHVVDGAEDIRVEFADRRTYSARLVGSDPPSDLAVLKIDADNLKLLTLGNSDGVRVGDVVLAIGNPLGIGQTVTAGIISAKGRSTGLSDGSFEDFLQTDAPINRGNSGGALVNTGGELIGINSQILSTSGGNIGIGFAIPSNMARNVMNQLVKSGKVRRGQLGISMQPLTSELAEGLGVSRDTEGILVGSVLSGSPAEGAGIKPGDIITALNGEKVGNDTNSFRNRIASSQPGTEVTLTLLRGGKEQQIKVRLGEFNERAARGSSEEHRAPGDENGGRLGLSAQPLTPDIARQLRLRSDVQGLVVTDVDPDGPAAEAGIREGDVILEINRQPVRSSADVRAAIKQAGTRPLVLLINRGGQTAFLTVRAR